LESEEVLQIDLGLKEDFDGLRGVLGLDELSEDEESPPLLLLLL